MRSVRILTVMMALCLAVIGQTNKGGISGTVTDQKGLAVPGATVTITNIATGTSIVLTSSSQGSFSASAVDPVLYNVRVEAPNFKKALVERVKVDTASVATVNVTIEAGNISEEVTIQADAQTVSADSGTLSQTITERQLRDLPLNNRSVLDLAVTMPNVSGDAGSEDIDAGFSNPSPGFNLSVNGGRPGSTSMLADGVNNTGVGIARAVVSFSPETVQEFSVQSSAYSAEFGTTGGGVINITTKSGANRFFGTALWYHRNPKTNARTWVQGTAPRPANNLRSNQTSFTVGGPIYLPKFGEDGKWYYSGKNKSFFFAALEPRWRNDFSQSLGLLPSAAERTGNFRDLVLTGSGWLPTAVATRFNLASLGADNNIYQQFTVGAGGTLVPIIVPTGTGNQYCPFGWTPTIGGVTQVSFNASNQPYCTATQATAQIGNVANNPALNIIPTAFLDPIGVKLMAFLNPPGEYFLDNGVVRNFFNLRQATQKERRYTVRLDHNFTDRTKATFRYTKTPAVGIRATSGSDINGSTGAYSDAQQYLVTMNKIISSSMTNEVRFNYTKGNFSEDFAPEFSIMGGRNFATELGIKSLTTGGLPVFGFSTPDGSQTQYASNDIGSSISTNNFNIEKRYDLSDTFYYTHGNMLWKIGGNLNRAQLQVTPFFSASGGRWQFRRIQTNRSPGGTNDNASGGNSLASLLIGVAQQADARPSINTYNYQWDSAALFVQNDWKVKPNFTLNLGLRYALQLPRTEANNLQGVFRPDMAIDQALTDAQRRTIATTYAGVLANDPIPSYVPTSTKIVPFAFSGRGGRSKSLIATDRKAFEPRLGFAWSPKIKILGFDTEKNNFVIRGGFGISHFPINGNNRGANPDLAGFLSSTAQRPATVGAAASSNTPNLAQPVRLTGNNPLQGTTLPLDTLLGTDANGLVYLNSLGIGAVAVDINDPDYGKVPSSQSWNLAVQFAPFRNSTIEIAYAANRGVHLYTPQININQRNPDTISLLVSNNINPAGNAVDPLGRVGLTGSPIGISIASLFSQYIGFEPLNKYFNAKSSSIRHAGYIDFRRRIGRGLSLTANYTFSKSLDNSSDASPDVRVLTSGSVRGQVSLGGTLDNDYALSAFDTTHALSSTFTWDLPFGKGRQFFKHAPWYVNGPFGGWIISGVGRVVSGNPYQPFITDANFLGGTTYNRVIRPDIVSGVPLKNPLWNPKCRVGTSGNASGGGCEPYLNPAAFVRPAKGKLGNAPRTINFREPMRHYLDLSIQKDFPMPFIGGEGKRKINLRIDAINVLNTPNFYLNSRGNTPFGIYNAYPSELPGTECIANLSIPTPTTTGTSPNCAGTNTTRTSALTEAEYNAWAGFNSQPLSTTTAGQAIIGQIRTMLDALRLAPRPGQPVGGGALPDNFFSIRLPQGFATSNSLRYDITTLQGYQLYRLRQQYNGEFGTLSSGTTGTSFGSPNPGTSQRYIQFGIRLIF